ncbi:MAG: hypothetical protein GY861_20975 [bacterium]|nr:hypothetical protein [bacterium]
MDLDKVTPLWLADENNLVTGMLTVFEKEEREWVGNCLNPQCDGRVYDQKIIYKDEDGKLFSHTETERNCVVGCKYHDINNDDWVGCYTEKN